MAIGSAVAMGSLAMMEEEAKQKGSAPVAHSVVEKKAPTKPTRGFAAGGQ